MTDYLWSTKSVFLEQILLKDWFQKSMERLKSGRYWDNVEFFFNLFAKRAQWSPKYFWTDFCNRTIQISSQIQDKASHLLFVQTQIRGPLNPPASDQPPDLRGCKQVENLSADPHCQHPGSTWSGTTTRPWCSPRRCRRSTGWWAAARAPESVTASRACPDLQRSDHRTVTH